jgi:hypothetical protein
MEWMTIRTWRMALLTVEENSSACLSTSMSAMTIPYSLIENGIPGVYPPVWQGSDDSLQFTSQPTIEQPISFVEDEELDVLHPVLFF